jgi:ABC-type transport system involved in multi-copper enzyme maturation permease subunit
MFTSHNGYQLIPSKENEGTSSTSIYGHNKLVPSLICTVILIIIIFTFALQSSNQLLLAELDFNEAITPFSVIDPTTINVVEIKRGYLSKPSSIFGGLRDKNVPLPTNSWCENFLIGSG